MCHWLVLNNLASDKIYSVGRLWPSFTHNVKTCIKWFFLSIKYTGIYYVYLYDTLFWHRCFMVLSKMCNSKRLTCKFAISTQ